MTSTDLGRRSPHESDDAPVRALNSNGGARIAAWTLVHEASHKWALTNDYAYADQPRFHNLTWQRSVRNAGW